MANIYQDAPGYLVSRLRKLKLTKAIRSALQQQYDMKFSSTCCIVGDFF